MGDRPRRSVGEGISLPSQRPPWRRRNWVVVAPGPVIPRPNALTAHTVAIVHSPNAAASRTNCGAAR